MFELSPIRTEADRIFINVAPAFLLPQKILFWHFAITSTFTFGSNTQKQNNNKKKEGISRNSCTDGLKRKEKGNNCITTRLKNSSSLNRSITEIEGWWRKENISDLLLVFVVLFWIVSIFKLRNYILLYTEITGLLHTYLLFVR